MNLQPEQITAIQHVTRWHTRFSDRPQSVAEHSHQVALLALYLAPESLSNEDRLTMVILALVHDAHEAVFGDIPSPAKALLVAENGQCLDKYLADKFWGEDNNPQDVAPPHVQLLVDVADRLEAAMYARDHLPKLFKIKAREAIKASLNLSTPGTTKVLIALDTDLEVLGDDSCTRR